MDEKKILNEINEMLPSQLEIIKWFVDSLLENKIELKQTNQEYQKKFMSIKCPECHMNNFKKNGHECGTQKYRCKECGRSFTITSGTILDSSRINYSQLKLVIKGILNIQPIYKIAKDTKLSSRQIYNLEIRIFSILNNIYNDIKLKNVIQVDEKYFRISFKGTKTEKMPRKSRKSGSQNLKCGISNEQVCVIVAIDSCDNIIIKIAGNGPASIDMISSVLDGKIESQSILVTDSKSSYIKFARKNDLILKQIPNGEHNVEDVYNLGELNELMSEIETYVNYIKRGISTRHLQQHLDFIKFRKTLKYTIDYLEQNEEMYKDSIIYNTNLKCRGICKTSMPIDVYSIYGTKFE